MRSIQWTTLIGGLVLLQILPLPAESPFLEDSRPPRITRTGNKINYRLIPGEKDAAEIVIGKQASKMTLFAAEELQSLLEQKLQVKYPIVRKPSPEKISLILGINSFSKAAGIDDSRLCRDAFIIKSEGNKIYILGRDDPSFDQKTALAHADGFAFYHEKGTVFGVYDFLERFADVGFFFAGGGTVIDPGPVAIPDIDIYDRPDFEARQVQPFEGRHFLKESPGRGIRERNLDMLRMRYQTRYVPCSHGLGNLGYWTRFGKSHPEYFAMDRFGRRVTGPRAGVWMAHYCYTSGVKEELYQDAKSCLLNEPASKRGIRMLENQEKTVEWSPTAQKPGSVFCAMPGDSFFRCECPRCKPFMKNNRTISDFYWGFVFDLAGRLQKEKIPGIVTGMVYAPYNLIPQGKKMPSNVYVFFATGGPWQNRYQEAQKRAMNKIREWVEFGGHKVSLWNYANKFDNAYPGIPQSTPRAVGDFYKNFSPFIVGAFLESETDFYQFNLLNYYVFGKVAWNVQTDVEKLLQNYCVKMFGPAAGPMRKFIDRLEELWLMRVIKNPVETDKGPIYPRASDLECWTRIYSREERENLARLLNQAEKMANKEPGPLARVKLFRSLFLVPILTQGKKYDLQTDSISRFTGSGTMLQDHEKIVIDGELDEPVWKKGGIYLQNISGKDTDRSRVILAADSKYLYIAFDFSEPNMNLVCCPDRKAGDDEVWKDNGLELFFNPDLSRKNYCQLTMNSAGNIRTNYYPTAYASNAGRPWNLPCKRAIKYSGSSWRGELRIPLSALHMQSPEKIVMNAVRHQVRRGMPDQYYSWSPYLNKSLVSMFHDPVNFGTVLFPEKNPPNLIQNEDFSMPERGKTLFGGKWYCSADRPRNTRIGFDSNTFISGFRSICLETRNGTDALRQDLPTLKPGTRYRISFFIKLENVLLKNRLFSGATLNIWSDRNLWFPEKRLSGTIPWTYQEFIFKTGPNVKKGSYLLLYLQNADGKVWFDRIRLEELP